MSYSITLSGTALSGVSQHARGIDCFETRSLRPVRQQHHLHCVHSQDLSYSEETTSSAIITVSNRRLLVLTHGDTVGLSLTGTYIWSYWAYNPILCDLLFHGLPIRNSDLGPLTCFVWTRDELASAFGQRAWVKAV
jgi:hypothetical protein